MSSSARESSADSSQGWRGAAAGKKGAGAAPGWRREAAVGELRPPGGTTGGAWLIAGLIALSMAGGGWLIVLVNRPVPKLPVVFLAETEYRFPFAPNSWILEDWEALAAAGSQSASPFQIVDFQVMPRAGTENSPVPSGSPLQSLATLKTARQSGRLRVDPARGILVVVSAQGLVNDAGEPCLAMAGSQPRDQQSWKRLVDLLNELQTSLEVAAAPPQRAPAVVVVLDCVRHHPVWEAGQYDERFVAATGQVVSQQRWHGLTVITSCAAGQRAWGLAEARGTLFGSLLRLGLSGWADQQPGSRTEPVSNAEFEVSGNGDGQVSVAELRDFLVRNVEAWSRSTRGVSQTPTVYKPANQAGEYDESKLTHALRLSVLNRLRDEFLSSRPEPPLALEPDLLATWDALERHVAETAGNMVATAAQDAAGSDSVRQRFAAPGAVAEVRRRLIWVEQALDGGRAYQAAARSELDGCQAKLRQMKLTLVDRLLFPPRIRAGLNAALSQPGLAGWQAAESGLRRDSRETGEGRLLALTVKSRLGELADRADMAAAVPDLRVFPWVAERLRREDSARRVYENWGLAVLTGAETAPGAALVPELPVEEYSKLPQKTLEIAEAHWVGDSLIQTLPMFARWIDAAPGGLDEAAPMVGSGVGMVDLWRRTLELKSALAARGVPGEAFDLESRYQKLQLSRESLSSGLQLSVDSSDKLAEELYLRIRPGLRVDLRNEDVRDSGADVSAILALLESGLPSQTTVRLSRRELRLQLRKLLADGPRRRESSRAVAVPSQMGSAGGALAAEMSRLVKESHTWGDWDEDTAGRLAASQLDRSKSSPEGDQMVSQAQARSVSEVSRWLARRSIEDFWGGGRDLVPTTHGLGTASMSKDGLAVGQLAPELARAEAADLIRLEWANVRFNRQFLVETRPILQHPPVIEQSIEVQILPGEGAGAAGDGGGSPVAGRAVLVLENRLGQPLARAPFEISASSAEPVLLRLPMERGLVEADEVTAVVTFRGGQRRFPVELRPAPATQTGWTPRDAAAPTVTVRRGEGGRQSIVFVLDCSASMREDSPVEGNTAAVTRLEAARSTLGELLPVLADSEGASVGVTVFGHRVGWSTKETGRLLTQTALEGPIPDGLKPYADVESILPLGRFDASAVERVQRRLSTVKAWGESPLYLSISRAIDELRRGPDVRNRTVIAITDGLNYQFNPPADLDITLDRLIAQATAADVRVCVIGFALGAEDQGRGRVEYGRLTQQTGGEFQSAEHALQLLDSLKHLLGPTSFEVTAGRFRDRRSIGETSVIARVAPGDIALEVEWEGRRRPLELRSAGSEAFELLVDPQTAEFRSGFYDRGHPRLFPLVQGGAPAPGGLQLATHDPQRVGSGVEFPMSLRRVDGGVVERPDWVWVELTPFASNGSSTGQTWYFQDPSYRAGTPNPVLDIKANNWPAGADRARIWLWTGALGAAPTGTFRFAEIAGPDDPAPPLPGGLQLRRITRQPLEADRRIWRIDVEETLPADSLPTLRIDVQPASMLRRTTRVFAPAAGRVVHQFEVANVDEQALDAVTIRVFEMAALRRESAGLPQSIDVNVPPNADTIPVGLNPQ